MSAYQLGPHDWPFETRGRIPLRQVVSFVIPTPATGSDHAALRLYNRSQADLTALNPAYRASILAVRRVLCSAPGDHTIASWWMGRDTETPPPPGAEEEQAPQMLDSRRSGTVSVARGYRYGPGDSEPVLDNQFMVLAPLTGYLEVWLEDMVLAPGEVFCAYSEAAFMSARIAIEFLALPPT